jgi:periodic tryptophan protein 1
MDRTRRPAISSGKGSNFAAIGTLEPDIEVWNLDIIDGLYPDAILGISRDEEESSVKPKYKRPKSKHKLKAKHKRHTTANDEYHVDSVLSLAANRFSTNLLASGSSDRTVKLWDLNKAQCAKSFDYHKNKVSSLAWHLEEATVLLSGSYDKSVIATDVRTTGERKRWKLESDIENVRWDPFDSSKAYVSFPNILFSEFVISYSRPQLIAEWYI